MTSIQFPSAKLVSYLGFGSIGQPWGPDYNGHPCSVDLIKFELHINPDPTKLDPGPQRLPGHGHLAFVPTANPADTPTINANPNRDFSEEPQKN